jgi:hypothetical protein
MPEHEAHAPHRGRTQLPPGAAASTFSMPLVCCSFLPLSWSTIPLLLSVLGLVEVHACLCIFPPCLIWETPKQFAGTPLPFKQLRLCFSQVPSLPVYGIAIPTVTGLRLVLDKLGAAKGVACTQLRQVTGQPARVLILDFFAARGRAFASCSCACSTSRAVRKGHFHVGQLGGEGLVLYVTHRAHAHYEEACSDTPWGLHPSLPRQLQGGARCCGTACARSR